MFKLVPAMSTFLVWILLVASMTPLQGCSVGMAMSGKKQPELGAIRVGATRGEIELQLGSPVEIREEHGQRMDVYEYEIGNEPSAGRAIGHGIMDVLTLGLWEAVGTPIEGVQGEKKRLLITYDENDYVTKVGALPNPPKQNNADTATNSEGTPTPADSQMLQPSM